MENRLWYETAYRRNLVDMHIEDWNEAFLRDFQPEKYAAQIEKAHIQAPMVYLQAHTGHCYWPTKSGHMHASLTGREDLVRRLVDTLRGRGMAVVGYYSLIYNTYEEDRRPDWRLRDPEGRSPRQRGGRYGLCCPNNPGYRAFVRTQVQEMAEYFTLDGIFFDMLFWPEFCYCDHCRKRWQAETGLTELPTEENWQDPVWQMWVRCHQQWMGEFAAWAKETANECFPGLPVEQNYASGVAGDWHNAACEVVNDACDYTGGDLYGDLYNHSFAAKYYRGITKHPPFEYMTCRCDADLSQHTVTKSEAYLKTEVLLTCAHHGASLVIDAIDPVGTLDGRFYDRLGRVFQAEMPYEAHLTGIPMADVGVYYCTRGRYDGEGQGFTPEECAVGAVRALVAGHVPTAVLSEGYPGDFSEFPLVLAPDVQGITEGERERLIAYVKNGGTLYFSGAGDEALLYALTGSRRLGMTESDRTYVAPTEENALFDWFTPKYPMPYMYALPRIQPGESAEVTAAITLPYTLPAERRFASIHSNPPGIPTADPAMLTCSCGKGRVIWSAACPEADARPAYREFLLRLVAALLPAERRSFVSDAPRQVELLGYRQADGIQICAVDLLCTDELLPIRPFTVTVPMEKAPSRLVSVPDGKELPFTWENGACTFRVENLVMFGMYEAKL